MPKFTQEPIQKAVKVKGIPQEVVDGYKKFVDGLENGNVGKLEFDKDEAIALGRKALLEAAIQSKKYVKARKVRGADNVLMFERITRQEFVEAQKRVEARAEKMRGKTRKKAATRKKK